MEGFYFSGKHKKVNYGVVREGGKGYRYRAPTFVKEKGNPRRGFCVMNLGLLNGTVTRFNREGKTFLTVRGGRVSSGSQRRRGKSWVKRGVKIGEKCRKEKLAGIHLFVKGSLMSRVPQSFIQGLKRAKVCLNSFDFLERRSFGGPRKKKEPRK